MRSAGECTQLLRRPQRPLDAPPRFLGRLWGAAPAPTGSTTTHYALAGWQTMPTSRPRCQLSALKTRNVAGGALEQRSPALRVLPARTQTSLSPKAHVLTTLACAQRAIATMMARAEVKLDTDAQLFEAGS